MFNDNIIWDQFKEIRTAYKVIDLFAGVGGLSYNFSVKSEFKITMANEIEKDISIAYSLNHPPVKVLNKDIKQLTADEIFETSGKNVDVIIGVPPCQPYSTLGKRKMDARAHLFEEYCRIFSIVGPKFSFLRM